MLCFFAATALSQTSHVTVLTNGESVLDDVSSSGVKTFKLRLDANAGTPNIQLVLTRLSGNPDLFVSLNETYPTNYSYDWSSTDMDGDVVVISHLDDKLVQCTRAQHQQGQTVVPCTVHMSVVGTAEGSSRFSLLASLFKVGSGFRIESPDALVGDYDFAASTFGRPLSAAQPLTAPVVYAQPGTACRPAGALDDWQMSNAAQLQGAIALVDRGGNDCAFPDNLFAHKVLVAQSAGAKAVIVANNRGEERDLVSMFTTSGEWPGYSSEQVTIPSIFVAKPTGDKLKASLVHENVLATLSQPKDRLPLLVTGHPTNGAATKNTMQYYTFWANEFRPNEISITLSAKFGNPDLYVSNTEQRPNPSFYTWRSENEGSDTLVISADDPLQVVNAKYTVGVLANGASAAYTLTFSEGPEAIPLMSNVPLPAQQVGVDEYRYYIAWVDRSADSITVAVTVLQGDADLYVSFTNTRPTADKASHSWAAVGTDSCSTVDCGNTIHGGDAVHISREEAEFCAEPNVQKSSTTKSAYCVAYIGVFGAQQSSFSVLVTISEGGTETEVSLLDAQPQDAKIEHAGSYAYFRFFVPQGAERVRFAVGAATNRTIKGDPDLYVRTSATTKPTRNKYDFKSTGSGREELTITTSDSAACEACTYHLAVYAWRDLTAFSITASVKMQQVTEEGEPLKKIEGTATALQRNVYTPFTLDDLEPERFFRFTLFWGNTSQAADRYLVEFVHNEGSAEVLVQWRLSAGRVAESTHAIPSQGGAAATATVGWYPFGKDGGGDCATSSDGRELGVDHSCLGKSQEFSLADEGPVLDNCSACATACINWCAGRGQTPPPGYDSMADYCPAPRDVYLSVSRTGGVRRQVVREDGVHRQVVSGQAVSGRLRVRIVDEGGGSGGNGGEGGGGGGGAGGVVVLVLLLVVVLGGCGTYAWLLHQGKRNATNDAAALKSLAAAAVERMRAAAANVAGRVRVSAAGQNQQLVAPLADPSYSPPEPTLRRLPSAALLPLGADGIASSGGERPNVGLVGNSEHGSGL